MKLTNTTLTELLANKAQQQRVELTLAQRQHNADQNMAPTADRFEYIQLDLVA